MPGSIEEVSARRNNYVIVVIVLMMLALLPLAVWLDVSNLAKQAASKQAHDLSSVISSIRSYYTTNVVGRVLAAHAAVDGSNGSTAVSERYATIPGAIPLPATLSLELGDVIGEQQANIAYRFVSDMPFRNRAPHQLDAFETDALASLRRNADQTLINNQWHGFTNTLRLVTPVVMAPACVACHNSHPESPKLDWKTGDVRGIQEIAVTQPFASNIFAFKYLLLYFVFVAVIGVSFITFQRQQARVIRNFNRELEAANEFLAGISLKISRYLSPQIYKQIFSGQRDVVVQTERKRLSIFFSDIKDFTATTERLQPEALTEMLNEYLTEMAEIALRHGGTIDKFIGDAVLIFFGDPETKGAEEDAKACLRMAIDMQSKLVHLREKWRRNGTEDPFVVRMGINTGYCNVGNFGSEDRMDYTIIGAEANLAARLQSIADSGKIVISYETYALVKDIVEAQPLPAITMKGISRAVIPYAVDKLIEDNAPETVDFKGLELDLNIASLQPRERDLIRKQLLDALAALDRPVPQQ